MRFSASSRVGIVSSEFFSRIRCNSPATRPQIGPTSPVSRSRVESWKTIASPSALACTSSSIPWSAAIAASKAARLFSMRPGPCRPRCAKGFAIRLWSLACLDGDDGIDLDGSAEREDRDSDGAARMPPGLAEHPLHQLGGAVGDLGLVGEAGIGGDERPQLDDSLDPVERSERLLDLGDQHHRAALRRFLALLEPLVEAERSGDQRAVLAERQLAGNVEQSGDLDRRNISGDGGGGLRQADVELGEAV